MLEKICTNLKTSKRLKELGFEAETNFLYTPTEITASEDKKLELQHWAATEYIVWKKDSLIPAYTLEQILSELPDIIEVNNSIYHLMISKNSIYYFSHSKLEVFANYQENNLSSSSAKLWIKLKEDKII
jgi:hypothetical protein|tara:strand:+ start:1108 stop:1494 length:387 start_codon:yes stop_codon:yes gene_type:complete